VRFPGAIENMTENPLDAVEEVLLAADYDCQRLTKNRLSFLCEGKQGCYTLYLEWHKDYNAVRCSVIMDGYRSLFVKTGMMDDVLERANETAWHGFFTKDGVGHIVFKSVVRLSGCPVTSFELIETLIDNSMEEADRLSVLLNASRRDHHSDHDDLFTHQMTQEENLVLALVEPKGTA